MKMDSEKYLINILSRQSLPDDCAEVKAMQSEREKIEKLIRKEFSGKGLSIQYAGSYKKGTMIKDSYDLDIICYLDHDNNDAGETIEDIFENVKKALGKEYMVNAKKSALRLYDIKNPSKKIDFHIDVVPGRYVDEKKSDTYLF